ncbi:MAG: NAD(P)/FAD-dependent oxidoreductase [Bacteroidia bacterium]
MDKIDELNLNNCYWQKTFPALSYEKLTTDITAEVVVTGEGLAATSVAYSLARSGKKVVLIAEKNLGTSDAGRTNSHLVTAVDNRYFRLEKIFGQEGAKLIADSHRKAIDHIERTCVELSVDCEFERLDGFLFLHPSDDAGSLSKELKAARTAGVSVTDLPFVLGTNKHIPCLKFYDQAQFHPMKYQKALCDALIRAGGKIYTNTGISKVDRNGVTTRTGHLISAKHIVVTGKSDNDHKTYRTYTIAGRIKKGTVRKFLWWDTGNRKESRTNSPYHYVRIQKFDQDHDLLICGGQSHPIDQRNSAEGFERYLELETWMRERFPVTDIVYRWTAEGQEPVNHVGYIGRKPGHDNIYVVSGDSGHGAMNATIAGMIIPDLIDGKENVWTKIYDPSQPVPSRLMVAVKHIFRGSLSFFQNKLKALSDAPGKQSAAQETGGPVSAKEEAGTDGLHSSGAIYWNNDEENWDRIQQQRKLIYDQKP